MATRHGLLNEFEASREDWTSYTERLQQYFAANDVDSAEKQRAILLSVCGAQTYQLLKNLLAPEKPTDKSFSDLVQLMKNHLQLRPSIIVERFTFHSRIRKEGSQSRYMLLNLNSYRNIVVSAIHLMTCYEIDSYVG